MLCGSAKIQRPGRQRILFGTHAWLARAGEPDRTLRTHLARPGPSYRQGVVRSGFFVCAPNCKIKAYDSNAMRSLGGRTRTKRGAPSMPNTTGRHDFGRGPLYLLA